MRLTMSKARGNYKLHLNADLEEHVHTEDLKSKYVYKWKYEFVELKARRAV